MSRAGGGRVMQTQVGLAISVVCSSALALQITQVRLDRNVFDPSAGERAAIRFHLDQVATVETRFYDGRDLLIRTIRTAQPMSSGDEVVTWDGKDETGQKVPAEAYHFTLNGVAQDGSTTIYDVTDTTGGEELTATDVAWDAQSHQIRYRLTQTARVSIRVGLQDNGPLLRTVLDWVPRPPGDNQDGWDGWDGSYVLDLSNHPKLSIFVDAYALSANTIIVGPPPSSVVLIDELSWGRHERERREAAQAKRMHYHSQQPIEQRGDLLVRLLLPSGLPKDRTDAPEVSGRVTLRLDIDARDRDRVIQQRFEPVFFIDGTFAFENEVGYLPFSWIWDTSQANEGIHYVTVNVRGYEGNFGMQTIKVHVRKDAADQRGKP